jgi:hypothetical protein
MDRYIIISPHTADECAIVVNQAIAAGYVTHVDWGCKDNDHTAWAIVEADSHEEALMLVPPIIRHKARAVRLVHYNPHERGA